MTQVIQDPNRTHSSHIRERWHSKHKHHSRWLVVHRPMTNLTLQQQLYFIITTSYSSLKTLLCWNSVLAYTVLAWTGYSWNTMLFTNKMKPTRNSRRTDLINVLLATLFVLDTVGVDSRSMATRDAGELGHTVMVDWNRKRETDETIVMLVHKNWHCSYILVHKNWHCSIPGRQGERNR